MLTLTGGSTRLAAVAGMALLAAGVRGQPPQQFEVAVIRPSAAGANAGTSFNVFDGGRLRITNEPVRLLIRAAFQVQNAQIAGGPAWLDTDRYDIEAKTGGPEKIKPGQMSALLQSLLADRFRLKYHRETRELPVFALLAGNNRKGGPKLKVKAGDEVSAMDTHGGGEKSQLVGTGVSMDALAKYVGNRLGRVVVDRTGLGESYDFTLEWAPDDAPDSPAPPLVTALREQLGLRLEPQKAPVEVIVIDGIERPSGN